ncbi:MAG: hypothetical protein QMD10_11420 [Desulfitobacteriaceae bacterium]|nr:hypothetical protein [Desulfitobacteriaceae bacterium]
MSQIAFRKKLFNPATQMWQDEALPTVTVKRMGWARAYSAGAVIASHYVGMGSPSTVAKTWIIQRARFFAGSPDTILSVVHSRLGSIDAVYFESPGEQLDFLESGVYKFPPGSVRFVMHLAGSTPRVGFGISVEGPEA